VATILTINYAFGVVFWVLLYPIVFSPLRRIPGPKVSQCFHLIALNHCASMASEH
jgi:hypothetical protein